MPNIPATDAGHPDMDYPEHERTFSMFIGLIKWGAILSIIVLVALAWMTL